MNEGAVPPRELKCGCNDPQCKNKMVFEQRALEVEGNTMGHCSFGKTVRLYMGAEDWIKLINIARSMLLEMTNGKLKD